MRNKITYNKLVRDKIPAIIEQSNKKSKVHIADLDNYKQALLDKLIEEAHELKEEPSIEELADVLEVINAIKESFNFKDDDIEKKRLTKKEARGGFNDRIILEYVYDESLDRT